MERGDDAPIAGARRRIADLEGQMAELAARLRESEETLRAIRDGEVDAVVVAGERGQQIYTLTNSDRPYRVLIEHMKEGAVALSHDGITVYCNASFAALVGKGPEHVVGGSFVQFVSPIDRPLFDMVFGDAQGGSVEITLAASEGGTIPVLLSVSPIPDNLEGRIVCAIVTDLREHHRFKALERGHAELGQLVEERTASLLRLVEERRVAGETLRQNEKLQLIGQLTGGIAHDFNNVLQVVSGGVRLLKSPRLGDERKPMLLDAMEQAARNAAEMVSRLLAFARKQTLNPKSFDLNERLRGMTDLLRHTLGPGVRVETDLAPDLWPILADPNQFEMALLNLAVNARDAMPSGGTLILRTFNKMSDKAVRHEAGEDKAEEDGAGGQVCVAVEDTGTGMSPAVRARVFEPFFTTKEVGKGTGLGLPQVHGFARQSGGDVTIDSEPDQGTRVTLSLPRAGPERAAPDAAASYGMSHGVSQHGVSHEAEPGAAMVQAAGKVVLVVDDNPEIATFAAAMLEGLGYTVRQAGNAPEALARLEAGEWMDAVFSDVVMPGAINGADLASILCLRYPRIAVVLATGYTDQRAKLSELPVEVLAKPYLLDDVAAALERALRRIGVSNPVA